MPEMTFQAALDLATRAHLAGQTTEAESLYRQLLAAAPADINATHRLAILLLQTRRLPEGLDLAQKTIALSPQFPDARNTLGMALQMLNNPDAAIHAYQYALALNPTYTVALDNLGNAYKDAGRIPDAIAAHRQALAQDPMNVTARDHLCYALYFDPTASPETILAENKIWDELHGLPLRNTHPPRTNDKHKTRRLRKGNVSPHLRDHVLALIATPLFSHHNHTDFEIFFYADVSTPDAHTARFQKLADTFRFTPHLNDQQLAEQIRADGIDILVDLTMHMGNNRLLTFARQAAPIQITWCAYPGTTGVSAIQYHLSDPYLDPPENAWMHTEETIRDLETFWCYDPASNPLDITDLPLLKNHYPTFACLNNFCKINEPTLDLWRQLLQQFPHSHLLLLCPEGEPRDRVRNHLKGAPVEIEFLNRMPRRQYLGTHNRIDLCLDTFPYNGHTTSLDALWMGLPTPRLSAQTPVSRAGYSQLSNMNLPHLITWTPKTTSPPSPLSSPPRPPSPTSAKPSAKNCKTPPS